MKFFLDNWLAMTGIIGSIVSFFSGWKLRNINEKKEGATALENIQRVYDRFSAQTDAKFKDLYKELGDLKSENLEQRKSIRDLQRDNRDLHKEVAKLMQKNNELLLENQQLRLINKTPAP